MEKAIAEKSEELKQELQAEADRKMAQQRDGFKA
jgi:hypothetical protein